MIDIESQFHIYTNHCIPWIAILLQRRGMFSLFQTYGSMSLDQEGYEGQSVLILGRGI